MKEPHATRTRIARAALELFVEKGVTETTTREIAARAGIAEGTIYRHFPSKDALALELFAQKHVTLAQGLEVVASSALGLAAKAEAITRAWCAMADKDWLLFRYHLLNQHRFAPLMPPDQPNPINVLRHEIATAMKAGELKKGDVELVTAMALGVVLQPAIHKVHGRLQGKLTPLADQLAAAVRRVLEI